MCFQLHLEKQEKEATCLWKFVEIKEKLDFSPAPRIEDSLIFCEYLTVCEIRWYNRSKNKEIGNNNVYREIK